MLVAWVVAEDLDLNAAGMVEKYGLLTKVPNTGLPIQSPYLPIVNKQAQIMLKAAEQFGFSPASRSQVQVIDSVRTKNTMHGQLLRVAERHKGKRSPCPVELMVDGAH